MSRSNAFFVDGPEHGATRVIETTHDEWDVPVSVDAQPLKAMNELDLPVGASFVKAKYRIVYRDPRNGRAIYLFHGYAL
jgi:hypothetical protein